MYHVFLGFGHALVKRLDFLGFTVIAGCLDDKSDGADTLGKWSDSGRIHVVQLDVTSDESVNNLFSYVQKHSSNGKSDVPCQKSERLCNLQLPDKWFSSGYGEKRFLSTNTLDIITSSKLPFQAVYLIKKWDIIF